MSYSIHEIFYSLQGEGVRAGTPNVFVRFAGCNLTCKMESHGFDCDTEFAGGGAYTMEQLLTAMARLGGDCRNVILTGGEPLLQVDEALVARLKVAGWYVALETNGSKELPSPLFDWVTCSPKVAEHAVRILKANEVKYVRHAGQAMPKPVCAAEYYVLSPAATTEGVDGEALAWCLKCVKENPKWRLSIQLHKTWSVR